MKKTMSPDPVIPFTVSRAMLIEQTATRVQMLMWMMGGLLAVAIAGFGYMVMHL